MIRRTTWLLALVAPTSALAATWNVPSDGSLQTVIDKSADGDAIYIDHTYTSDTPAVIRNRARLTLVGSGGVPQLPGLIVESSSEIGLTSLELREGSLRITAVLSEPVRLTCTSIDNAECTDGMACLMVQPICSIGSTIHGTSITVASSENAGVRGWGGSIDLTDSYVASVRNHPAFEVVGTDLTLTACTLEDNDAGAIDAGIGSNVTLDRVAMRNNGVWGETVLGGDVAVNRGTLTMFDSTSEYSAAYQGGSIFATDSTVDVSRTTFTGNSADYGAAIAITGSTSTGSLHLSEVVLDGSWADIAGGVAVQGVDADLELVQAYSLYAAWGGAALYAENSTVTIDEMDVYGVAADWTGYAQGGAVHLFDAQLDATGLDVDALVDGVVYKGGGLFLEQSEATLHGGSWSNLSASYGGGIYGSQSTLTLDQTRLWGNSAAAGGAVGINDSALSLNGVRIEDNGAGEGAAVWAYAPNPLSIADSAMLRNAAFTSDDGTLIGLGGALYLQSPSSAEIERTLFCANHAALGGGAVAGNGSAGVDLWLHNNVFFSNTTDEAGSGNLLVWSYADAPDVVTRVVNNTFLGGSGPFAEIVVSSIDLDLRNNIVMGASTGLWAAPMDSSQPTGDTAGGWNLWWNNGIDTLDDYGHLPGLAPVFADPAFQAYIHDDCEKSNLWLKPDSPARDAGDPSQTDPDGSRSDIGAFGGPAAFIPDRDGDGVTADLDCNDGDATVAPGLDDVCDGVDNNCDGRIDEGFGGSWWPDIDQDGFGDATVDPIGGCAPDGPQRWVDVGGDCDDLEPEVNPLAAEVPSDGIDNDCDGFAAEAWVRGEACGGCAGLPASPAGFAPWLLVLVTTRRRRP